MEDPVPRVASDSSSPPPPLPDYSADPVRRRYFMTGGTADNGIEHRVAPVLSFFGIGFSIRNDTDTNSPTQLQVSARCVVGLWNPYTSALVPEDLELVVRDLPTDVSVRDTLTGAQWPVPLAALFSKSVGDVKLGASIHSRFLAIARPLSHVLHASSRV